MTRVVSSQIGSSSRGYFTSERSASVQEMGCVEVPQTGSTIRRSKLWRRLSLIVKLSRWFRNIAEIKKLEELQQVDAWVGASWLALSRHTSVSVPNIGQLHNSHEVGMAVRLEDWRELAVEPNQSWRFHRIVNLDQVGLWWEWLSGCRLSNLLVFLSLCNQLLDVYLMIDQSPHCPTHDMLAG